MITKSSDYADLRVMPRGGLVLLMCWPFLIGDALHCRWFPGYLAGLVGAGAG